MQGRSMEVVTENPIEEIIAAVVSILCSFCVRLYEQRRARHKTEKLVQDLNVKTE
jgi:putative resolvase